MAQTQLSVTLQDATGVKATTIVDWEIDGTVTIDGVGTQIDLYLPLLDATTDAVITEARLIWVVDLPGGLKAAPVAKSNVQKGLLQGWTQATITTKKASTLIPGVAAALLTVNGQLNQANAAYLAWRGFLLAQILGSINFQSQWAYQITGHKDVAITFRKHRKPQVEKTEQLEP